MKKSKDHDIKKMDGVKEAKAANDDAKIEKYFKEWVSLEEKPHEIAPSKDNKWYPKLHVKFEKKMNIAPGEEYEFEIKAKVNSISADEDGTCSVCLDVKEIKYDDDSGEK